MKGVHKSAVSTFIPDFPLTPPMSTELPWLRDSEQDTAEVCTALTAVPSLPNFLIFSSTPTLGHLLFEQVPCSP